MSVYGNQRFCAAVTKGIRNVLRCVTLHNLAWHLDFAAADTWPVDMFSGIFRTLPFP